MKLKFRNRHEKLAFEALNADIKAELKNAETALYFIRTLAYVKARVFEVVYGDLLARSLFPLSTEGDPIASSVVYDLTDKRGSSKTVADNYVGDFPRVDVDADDVTRPVRNIVNSFGVAFLEVLRAQRAGINIADRKAKSARRASEEEFNDIIWDGKADLNIRGLFSTAWGIDTANVAGADATARLWVNKTPKLILADINEPFITMRDETLEMETADTVLLPTANYDYIAATPYNDTSDKTILQFIVDSCPWLASSANVKSVPRCKGQGVSSTNRMVHYTNDAEKLEVELLWDFSFLEPEKQGLEVVTRTMMRTAGLNMYKPASVRFRDGI